MASQGRHPDVLAHVVEFDVAAELGDLGIKFVQAVHEVNEGG
jgi:hypothetical protein